MVVFYFLSLKKREKKLKITQISMQQNRTPNYLIGRLHASTRFNGCYIRNGNRLKERMCAAFLFYLMGSCYTFKIFMFVQCNKLHCTNTRKKCVQPQPYSFFTCFIILSLGSSLTISYFLDHFQPQVPCKRFPYIIKRVSSIIHQKKTRHRLKMKKKTTFFKSAKICQL